MVSTATVIGTAAPDMVVGAAGYGTAKLIGGFAPSMTLTDCALDVWTRGQISS